MFGRFPGASEGFVLRWRLVESGDTVEFMVRCWTPAHFG
ncbi:hypothetical protein RISK_006042 [Rhodopirellula islandica]|uniref:Uncharacterized protein n=1 Tax=Rhodopirellula islandica TaxID=595434 RepID=A0A0J1B5H5_RHOIS|nr:hypothetical protein RISK_006042 [Rhodopirellula islandica]